MAPIACIEEGRWADSGNLGSRHIELEEELKSSAGRSSGLWRQEERDSGRDSGRERDENIAPEGLVGFFREKITVKSSLSLFCQSLYHFGF